MVVTVLATDGEIAFPYGIAEDEFRGPEIIAADGVAFNASIHGAFTFFSRYFMGIAR